MRTIRTKVYKFKELSKKAQSAAIENYRNKNQDWIGDFEYDDAGETLKEFCKLFNINYRNIDYLEPYRNQYSVELEDNILELTGQRLATYVYNHYRYDIYGAKQYWICEGHKNCIGANAKHRDSKIFLWNEHACPLTGMYYDSEILKPLFNFMRKPGNEDFEELLGDCINALCKSVQQAIKFRNSDEAIREDLEANEDEFLKDGGLV